MQNAGKWFLFLLLFGFVARGNGDVSCPDLQKAWNGRYLNQFDVNWDTSKFECPGPDAEIALTLYNLENLRLKPMKGGGVPPRFFRYVRDRMKHIRYDPNCLAPMYAFTDRGTATTTLCPAFFSYSHEFETSGIVHEARHIDPDDPGHVNCVGGLYDGAEGACDKEFNDGLLEGSGYNADIWFLGWAIRRSTSNELQKSLLRGALLAIVPDRFNGISEDLLRKWRRLR